jgi:hypothetical protein
MKKIFFLLCLTAFALSSCNLPIPEPPAAMSPNDQAATIVARTLQAIAPLASATIEEIPTYGQPVFPSATADGPAPTIQPQATPTGGATGTPTATTLTVDLNTNCRAGPGLEYKIVITLLPGETYQMIARSTDNKYWVVTQIGQSTPCWVLAEYSNAFGNINLLPVITPSAPTAPAAAPVVAPSIKNWKLYCYGANLADITIEWNDKSSTEDGYRVLRNGVLVADLPANSNYFFETINLLGGQSVGYQVQAYNSAGFANSATLTMTCPP